MAKDQVQLDIDKLKEELEKLRQPDSEQELKAHAQNYQSLPSVSLKTKRFLKGHFGKIYAMHWSTNGRHLVSASQDGKLIVWNGFTTNKMQAIPLRSSWVMTCAFYHGANGDMVACGGLDNLCSIYKLDQAQQGVEVRQCATELAQHEGYLSCCRFIDEDHIITSSGDSTCIHWNISKKQVVRQFTDHSGDVMSVSVHPTNANLFVSGSCDATAKLWDVRSRFAVATFTGHESDINSVNFFPDGNAFGTGSDDSSCRLFSTTAYKQLNIYSNDKILCGITSVAFSHSGKLLFGGYDDYNCYVWDTVTTDQKQMLAGHENRISSLGVSPAPNNNYKESKGSALCTGSWDTLLRVWA